MENKPEIILKYEALKINYASAFISYNEKGQKLIKPPSGWASRRKCDPRNCEYESNKNGLIILNKTPIREDKTYYLIIIDLDKAKNKNETDGEIIFNKLTSKIKINTLTQATPSGGKHYLFKTNNKTIYNSKQLLKIRINGKKENIDIPTCIAASPSNNYKWDNINKYNNLLELQELPEILENIILDNIENPNGFEIENIKPPKLTDELISGKYQVFDILINEFYDYKNWVRMAFFMKNLNYPFEIFNYYSKKHPKKYDEAEAKRQWEAVKFKKLNEGILHSMAKNKDPLKYKELGLKFQFSKEDTLPDNINFIEINKEYLIKQDNINLSSNNCIISKHLKEFTKNDNIKSFNIKSPYNTGKTQLLKRYIQRYEPKKILWLSYRKTLTNDIYGNFEELNFKNYMEGNNYEQDRLILQIESINKLKGYIQNEDDETDIPYYDLIVIDEIESILNQFNSNTINKHSRYTFNFLEAIIKNSNKLITLDGDLDNRAYKFISNFGNSINIVNKTFKETKNINFIFDNVKFYDQIKDDVKNGVNIAVACQSSKMAEELFYYVKHIIKKQDDEKDELIDDGEFIKYDNIGLYLGNTSDKKKEELKDVINIWDKLKVLIYSPTIEAGVSFDKKHFSKLYGIATDGANTQRGFIQMLSRVRKFESRDISIFCNLKYYKFDKSFYNSYHEVKDNLIQNNIIELNEIYEHGKIKKVLTSYDINHIYNKREELLKDNKYFYLGYMKEILEKKGHIVKVDEPLEVKTKEERTKCEIEEFKINRNERILQTKDINEEQFEEYLKKQKEGKANENINMKLDKHFIKKRLGVECLDIDILNKFVKNKETPIINNILYLIDANNIKKTDTNKYKETIIKNELVKDIIDKLGFKLFKSDILVKETDFKIRVQNIIETNKIFTEKGSRTLFKTYNYKVIQSNKQFLFFINSILLNYGLKIRSERKRIKKKDKKDEGEGKEKEQVYNMEFLEGFNEINEIIQYKINRGFKIEDKDNIRPTPTTTTYQNLIDNEIWKETVKYKKEINKGKKNYIQDSEFLDEKIIN